MLILRKRRTKRWYSRRTFIASTESMRFIKCDGGSVRHTETNVNTIGSHCQPHQPLSQSSRQYLVRQNELFEAVKKSFAEISDTDTKMSLSAIASGDSSGEFHQIRLVAFGKQ